MKENLGHTLDELIVRSSEICKRTGLSPDEVIQHLLNEHVEILEMMKAIYEQQFEVRSIPEYKLMRGKQGFWTRMLENNISNKVLFIEEPTAITHIYRCDDTYDLLTPPADMPVGSYISSLIQILVNGVSLSNREFDVSALPHNAEHALKLSTPLYLNEADRIELVGADAILPNLRIGLQGFLVGRKLDEGEKITKPFILTEYLLVTDTTCETHKPIIIPTWMNLCLMDTWSFNRIQPSDSNELSYADYNIPINSPADGDILGSATLNVEYYRGNAGKRFVWNNELTPNWCGTREFPRPMHNLFPDARTNMSLRGNNYLLANAGQGTPHTYRWWFGMGKSEVAHSQ